MTRPRLAARRAEEFAQAVDGARPTSTEALAPLVRTVTLLREQPRPVPRPEFVTDLRAHLMAAADEALAPARTPAAVPSRRRRMERRLGAVVAAAVLVGSTGGLAYAAEGALPGSPLYPIKRGLEHVQVTMNTSQAARGKEFLEQASTRLHEVDELMAEGAGSHEELIRSTLDDFTSSASEGSDLLFATYQGHGNGQDIATVRDFTTSNMGTLQSLAKGSPRSVAGAFDTAGATLSDIDEQALVLCQTCSSAPAVALPSSLLDLSSVKSLTSLVIKPLDQLTQSLPNAARSRAEARAAEDAAKSLGQQSTTPAGTDGTTQPSPSGSPLAGVVSTPPLDPDHPVTGLVSTLTGVLPPLGSLNTSGVTDSLDGVVRGLTDGIGGLTQGLLGGGSGTQGSPSSSPSPKN